MSTQKAHLSKWFTNPDDDNATAVCLEEGCNWIKQFLTYDEATELALGHAEEADHMASAERFQWRTATPSCYIPLIRQEKQNSMKGETNV